MHCNLGDKSSMSNFLPIEGVVDGIIDLIKKNLIAATNVTSDVTTGNIVINVVNSFQFEVDQEIVFIDYGYNISTSNHYHTYEYARIKEVNNTTAITLHDAVVGNWLVSDQSFIQKTIGHSPLYEDRVYFGDMAVVPLDNVAITVQPDSLSNDWMFIQGGLTQEYKLSIMVYTSDIKTSEGLRILMKYVDAIYALLQGNIDLDIDNYEAPLIQNASALTRTVIVEDTEENRENFEILPPEYCRQDIYEIQDNENVECARNIDYIAYVGNQMRITLNTMLNNYSISEFAVFRRHGRFLWDSRVDGIEYATVSKGSAIVRVGRLSWYGKEINIHVFPQKSNGVDNF